MIKYVSFLIFSTVLFINTNAFSMDESDPLSSSDRGILGAWVNKDMEAPSGQSTTAEEETDNNKTSPSRVLIKKNDTKQKDPKEEEALLEASLGREDTLDPMLDNEVPLLTKSEFAVLIFFKFFIQAPIEMADVLANYTSTFLGTDDNLCADNYIYNFKGIVDYKEDDDS